MMGSAWTALHLGDPLTSTGQTCARQGWEGTAMKVGHGDGIYQKISFSVHQTTFSNICQQLSPRGRHNSRPSEEPRLSPVNDRQHDSRRMAQKIQFQWIEQEPYPSICQDQSAWKQATPSEVALCPLLPWSCAKLSWNIWFRDYQYVFYLEKVFFHRGKVYFNLLLLSI